MTKATLMIATCATLLWRGTVFAAGGLPACMANLNICTGSLNTCNNGLNSCDGDLSSCNGNLQTCNDNLQTCSGDLASCTNDLAVAGACGNGVVDLGEQCDFGDLNGESCATQTPATPYGKLACTAGCVFDTSGCVGRFVDNGDGTVTDNETNLQWEKKTNLDTVENYADPHDADNVYALLNPALPPAVQVSSLLLTLNDGVWPGSGCGSPDGVTMYCALATCKHGFAHHCDWRLPTLAELQGIVDLSAKGCGSRTGPCIYPAFGDTIVASKDINPWYWSDTFVLLDETREFSVSFYDGLTQSGSDLALGYVRAVRAIQELAP